jgi:hypothetical protein
MRRAEVVTGLRLPSMLIFRKILQAMCVGGNVLVLIAVVGCKGMPTLEEQERLVKENNLVLDHVTTRAVVNVWGEPPHHRSLFTHFFVMSDQRMIPSMRVVAGETPRGWSADVHAGEGLFFAYPERGWLLVFLGERLVYKEELKAEELRTIVKTWAYEDRFKTRLEGAPGP